MSIIPTTKQCRKCGEWLTQEEEYFYENTCTNCRYDELREEIKKTEAKKEKEPKCSL